MLSPVLLRLQPIRTHLEIESAPPASIKNPHHGCVDIDMNARLLHDLTSTNTVCHAALPSLPGPPHPFPSPSIFSQKTMRVCSVT